jgi:hypothetical protein
VSMCLAEVRGVDRGADFPRCNEKRENIKRADVRLPAWGSARLFHDV